MSSLIKYQSVFIRDKIQRFVTIALLRQCHFPLHTSTSINPRLCLSTGQLLGLCHSDIFAIDDRAIIMDDYRKNRNHLIPVTESMHTTMEKVCS